MKKYFYPALFLLLTGFFFSAGAESVPFRGGEVLAAQLSTRKPQIQNEDPLAFPPPSDKQIYAAVVVKLMPGRALSIFDYSLVAFGQSYCCVAIRAGNNPYDAAKSEFKTTSTSEKYSLLFVLDGSVVGFTPLEKLQLKANFGDKNNSTSPLILENLGNRDFTAPGSIPDSGIVKVQQ